MSTTNNRSNEGPNGYLAPCSSPASMPTSRVQSGNGTPTGATGSASTRVTLDKAAAVLYGQPTPTPTPKKRPRTGQGNKR